MKNKKFIQLFTVIIVSISLSSFGFAKNKVPSKPKLKASAYILINAKNGEVLAAKNADVKRHPASLTKLMTLYVISKKIKLKKLKLKDEVLVSRKAWRTKGSRMFIRVGKTVTVEKLIKGIIVHSGNDASVAIAEYISGTEKSFVNQMNQEAKKLRLLNTHYSNCNGLPKKKDRAYTTARDLALLTRALIVRFPKYYNWYSQKWFTHNKIKQPNRNRLLWHNPYVDGLKTGYTYKAGYCSVVSAKKGETRLISVVLGAPSSRLRHKNSDQLLTYGFSLLSKRN